jgi:hypothetical protein
MSDDCMICCEKYTKTARKRVGCPHCDTSCCSACFAKYLLNTPGEAHCMNAECKRAFDGEFLAMHLSRTWLLSKYKVHREHVLLDREMALLPASQDILANYRHAKDLQRELEALDARRREMQLQLQRVVTEAALVRNRIEVLARSNYTRRAAGGAAAAAERRQFVRACPMDGCRGFLSTAWKCGTCETWVCKDCGEPKLEGQRDEAHVCDPGVAASHALLQRDSRPCPQCAAMIFKIDGCDQASAGCMAEGVPRGAGGASHAVCSRVPRGAAADVLHPVRGGLQLAHGRGGHQRRDSQPALLRVPAPHAGRGAARAGRRAVRRRAHGLRPGRRAAPRRAAHAARRPAAPA